MDMSSLAHRSIEMQCTHGHLLSYISPLRESVPTVFLQPNALSFCTSTKNPFLATRQRRRPGYCIGHGRTEASGGRGARMSVRELYGHVYILVSQAAKCEMTGP